MDGHIAAERLRRAGEDPVALLEQTLEQPVGDIW